MQEAGYKRDPVERGEAESRTLAQLRQSVWETSQFVSGSYIKRYVAEVCREIKRDES